MKLKRDIFKAFVAIVFILSTSLLAGTYSGGTGTAEAPYQIATVADWQELTATSADWDKCFILMADIDLSGITYTQAPVAPDADNSTYYFQGTQFTGVFDGNHKTMSNLTINAPTQDYIGLFGYLGSEGQIRNMGTENVYVMGYQYVGGLLGFNNGTITTCHSTGTIDGSWDVGGLVGCNNDQGSMVTCYTSSSISGVNGIGGVVGLNYGTVTSCHTADLFLCSGENNIGGLIGFNLGVVMSCYISGAISGENNIGGLVGFNYGGTIVSCYVTGMVYGYGNASKIGGLVGGNEGDITSCYAINLVNGNSYVGGLIGRKYSSGAIIFCYSTGSVSGNTYVGGMVGDGATGINACFWDIQTSGQTFSAGGIGKTTTEMKTLSIYTEAGWDFTETDGDPADWWMPEGDYPQNTSFDCNGNWVYDYLDVQSGSSQDCNGNGIPDECEPDCNNNGIPDDCDISIGTSQDCNGNNIPDTCDISDGTSQDMNTNQIPDECEDCNNNGIPDDYDISYGISQDINSNWIPDECELDCNNNGIPDDYDISSGTSKDDNGNGVPDECGGYFRGDGSVSNPYQIKTIIDWQELVATSADWDKHFILMANINLSGISYANSPIAPDIDPNTDSFQGTQFTGVFDGNDHIINNLSIDAIEKDYIGLFGFISFGGKVKNLGLENINIAGDRYVGGIAGTIWSESSADFCYSSGIVNGRYEVGGLAGYSVGTITSSYSDGSISGDVQVGGLVGHNHGGTITSCYATGSVSGIGTTRDSIGGLVGYLYASSIEFCYSTGMVNGISSIGGLVGCNAGDIMFSYSTGTVDGDGYVGGLAGVGSIYGAITSSYTTSTVSGRTKVGGLVGWNYSIITITDNFTIGVVNGTGDYIGELVGESNIPVTVEGIVPITSSTGFNTHRWNNLILQGSGTLNLNPDVTLNLGNSTVSCNIAGQGLVQIDSDTTLTIEGIADVNLPGDGDQAGIQCDGLLHVKDNVTIHNTKIEVTRLQFEGDVDISNSVITAEAGSPYGQFFIEDTVSVIGNEIHADGDRYMDLDPEYLQNMVIANNTIYVTITEGTGSTRGGLFELRGDPNLAGGYCLPDQFYCELPDVPAFDTQSWTLEELELLPGAKVNLTNRFDFQTPLDSGGHDEVLYVKTLILGPDSQLNTAYNHIYYGDLIGDPNCIKNKPLLGFSLNNVACNNDNEFVTRIVHNNYKDPDPATPDYSRTHVSRVAGPPPDYDGWIQMCNLTDTEPGSPTEGQVVNARAKALFAKASEDKILVYFEYLFQTSNPSVYLAIYLSDHATIMNHGNPAFNNHYVEVARLYPPLPGQPGSYNSGRFGVFKKEVFRQELDFKRGTRVEFELVGPSGSCILIDNWDPYISCNYCGDVDGEDGVTEMDFLVVLGKYGTAAGLTDDNNSHDCLDGEFSKDGYVNIHDTIIWDWALNTTTNPDNLCGTCLLPYSGNCVTNHFPPIATPVYVPSPERGLLIAGKRGSIQDAGKRNDMLALAEPNGIRGDSILFNKRTNSKLVLSPDAQLYQLNAEEGLLRLSDSNSVVPPADFTFEGEPRFGRHAIVYVGLQNNNGTVFGRAILDAAFDDDGYVYVVPAVVEPNGYEPYLAAARLRLLPGQTPGYSIDRLYDDFDPNAPNDNRNLMGLKEIEVDEQGCVYVLNTGKDNDSDILWKYNAENGDVLACLILKYSDPNILGDPNIAAPIALHVSSSADTLYLASSQNEPEADSTKVYVLNKDTLDIQKTITVQNMGHVTGITENPSTGDIYVVGVQMSNIPPDDLGYNPENEPPFYDARLAIIPPVSYSVVASDISGDPSDPNEFLSLPLSVVFLGDNGTVFDYCQGADINGDNSVTSLDLSFLISQWLSEPGNPSADIALPKDSYVDIEDLAILAQHWLQTGCTP